MINKNISLSIVALLLLSTFQLPSAYAVEDEHSSSSSSPSSPSEEAILEQAMQEIMAIDSLEMLQSALTQPRNAEGQNVFHLVAIAGNASEFEDLIQRIGVVAQNHSPDRGQSIQRSLMEVAISDVRDSSGSTALSLAVLNGNVHVVTLLLHYGLRGSRNQFRNPINGELVTLLGLAQVMLAWAEASTEEGAAEQAELYRQIIALLGGTPLISLPSATPSSNHTSSHNDEDEKDRGPTSLGLFISTTTHSPATA